MESPWNTECGRAVDEGAAIGNVEHNQDTPGDGPLLSSDDAATLTRRCQFGNVHRHLRQLELTGPVPAAGAELLSAAGAAAGQITSAAQLALPGGTRTFALGMIRAEAEVSGEPFTYTAGTATGVARILAAPPAFQ